MENGNQIKELIKDIAVLKADKDTANQVHNRLDDAITKLTDISAGIKSMLAVHEEKLRRVDTSQDDLFTILEDRRREWEDDLKELGRVGDCTGRPPSICWGPFVFLFVSFEDLGGALKHLEHVWNDFENALEAFFFWPK